MKQIIKNKEHLNCLTKLLKESPSPEHKSMGKILAKSIPQWWHIMFIQKLTKEK